MPVLRARDADGTCTVIFPTRDPSAPGGWVWPELEVVRSGIEGVGLAPRSTEKLDWSELERPCYMPLIGLETEVSTEFEVDVFARVLQGAFVSLPASALSPPPAGEAWMALGPYAEPHPTEDAPAEASPLDPTELVLQVDVSAGSVGRLVAEGEPDSCVYMVARLAAQLLHIPPHIFELLCAHQRLHHVDRTFSTHVASYRREHGCHVMLNAHPIFADAAFALGCVNEPPPGESPTLEMRAAQLRLLKPRDEEEAAAAAWHEFVEEHPEVLERHIYFVTLGKCYDDGAELTASYGPAYHRSYASRGFEDPPPTARVRRDKFSREALGRAAWPVTVPGWWNAEIGLQPLSRPAFRHRRLVGGGEREGGDEAGAAVETAEGAVGEPEPELAPDRREYVLARKLLAHLPSAWLGERGGKKCSASPASDSSPVPRNPAATVIRAGGGKRVGARRPMGGSGSSSSGSVGSSPRTPLLKAPLRDLKPERDSAAGCDSSDDEAPAEARTPPADSSDEEGAHREGDVLATSQPRPRGRPRAAPGDKSSPKPRGRPRGRPRKIVPEAEEAEEAEQAYRNAPPPPVESLAGKRVEICWPYRQPPDFSKRTLIWCVATVEKVADGVSDLKSERCRKPLAAGTALLRWEADEAFDENASTTWTELLPHKFNVERAYGWRLEDGGAAAAKGAAGAAESVGVAEAKAAPESEVAEEVAEEGKDAEGMDHGACTGEAGWDGAGSGAYSPVSHRG